MKRFVSLLALGLAAGPALAPAAEPLGTAINYAGHLQDAGQPATGLYDFRVALFDAAAGGNQIGPSLTLAGVGVSNGLFSLSLDFGAGAFNGDARWLEPAVRTNGTGDFTLLTPRQAVKPAPYALLAASATAASTVPAAGLTGTLPPAAIAPGSLTGAMLAAGAVDATHLAAGAVGASALADGAVTAAKLHAPIFTRLAATLLEPAPWPNDRFGGAVAAVGSGQVLVGAFRHGESQAVGVAHLFSADGGWLATFENPEPHTYSGFGQSLAGVGQDRVLIGTHMSAHDASGAYLFHTNGALLTTFLDPNPAPLNAFGRAVAALGDDRVAISAEKDDTVAEDAGAVHVFSTDGAPLATLLNPALPPPAAAQGYFGSVVAAVGAGQLAISAGPFHWGGPGPGVVYLFDAGGWPLPLATFTLPPPAVGRQFGCALAAVGNDRLLIGASDVGAAYLFRTDGTLLRTFNSPNPGGGDGFGSAVAVVGEERVLIGAFGGPDGGRAYLFNTDGALLATLDDPAPESWGFFGAAVAAVGGGRVLVGKTSWTEPGAVYGFDLESYTPGLVAESVRAGAVGTAQLADGAVTAAKVGGALRPDQIPELDAAKLTSGTLADARLSANVALLDTEQAFTGGNRFAGVVTATNAANQLVGAFAGDGAGLTNLPAGHLTGLLADARLSTNVPRLDAPAHFRAPLSATLLSGDGAGLTNLPLGALNLAGTLVQPAPAWRPGGALVTGRGPSAPATVDLNRDGWPDVVTGNHLDDTLSVFANDGGGALTLASTVALPDGPVEIRVADVNRDGWPDLLASGEKLGRLVLATNDGAGGLALAGSWSTAPAFHPYGFAAGDFNGDGWVDAVVGNSFTPAVVLLTNNGVGGFAPACQWTAPWNAVALTALDAQRDGRLDFACVGGAGPYGLVLYLNHGDGSFTPVGPLDTGRDNAWAVETADLNRDGWADLLVGHSSAGTVAVLTNDREGSFSLVGVADTGRFPDALAVADLNRDGWLDVLSGNYTEHNLSVLTNDGRGGLALQLSLPLGLNSGHGAAVADLDRDGWPDLLGTSYDAALNGQLSIFYSASAVAFSGRFTGDGQALTNLAAAHLTGTLADARLSANVALLNANQAFTGANQFHGPVSASNPANQFSGAFAGDGTGLSSLNADALLGGLTTNLPVLAPDGGTNLLCFTNGVLRAIR